MGILKILKSIKAINAIRRFFIAAGYFNHKYPQIIKWLFTSDEDTNFTYNITEKNKLYLAYMISEITGTDTYKILEYFSEVSYQKIGRRLGWYAFARIIKPKLIIETGVDRGLGAALLCEALERNQKEGFPGRYIGTDINPNAGELLKSKCGKIICGDSIETLSGITDKIDLFINDSDHSPEYEYGEYKTIKNLITDKTIILGDNANCTDKLVIFSRTTGRRFLYFKEDPEDHWYPGSGIGISYKNK